MALINISNVTFEIAPLAAILPPLKIVRHIEITRGRGEGKSECEFSSRSRERVEARQKVQEDRKRKKDVIVRIIKREIVIKRKIGGRESGRKKSE